MMIAEAILQSARWLRVILQRSMQVDPVRMAALQIIHNSRHGCSQSQLARCLNRSESGVSELIGRMRRDGLLYRMRSKQDARTRLLVLSEQGRRRLAELQQVRQEQLQRVFSSLDAERQARIVDALRLVCDALAPFETDDPTPEPEGAVPAA